MLAEGREVNLFLYKRPVPLYILTAMEWNPLDMVKKVETESIRYQEGCIYGLPRISLTSMSEHDLDSFMLGNFQILIIGYLVL